MHCSVIFRIYNNPTATVTSARLWSEKQVVAVEDGAFSVVLGEGGPYSSEQRPALSTLFTNADASDRYMEMTVQGIGPAGGDLTMLPRMHMVATPYAMLAQSTSRLAGESATNYMRMDQGGSMSGTIQASSFTVGANAGYFLNGLDPGLAFDANDSLQYSRANNQAKFVIGGNPVLTINSSGAMSATGGFVGGGMVPIGTIVMWTSANIPSGWAVCDGTVASNFQTPDLRSRFIMASGAGSGLTTRTVGQTGGEQSHVLTVAEMASHVHTASGSTSTGGSHDHGYNSGHGSSSGIKGGSWHPGEIGYGDTANTTSTDGSHSHPFSFTSGSTGSGSAYGTVPVYYALTYIVRVQ
jgi:microcystin-dependent protein